MTQCKLESTRLVAKTVALAIALCSSGLATADAPRPNIVVIMCDDLGYSDVGFNGAEDIVTAELDALAQDGMVMTSAYVPHPFCGPSRMGMMTGRYPHTIGAPFNLPNSAMGVEQFNRQGVDVNETLISTMLQSAGYRTGAVGKWHMGIEPKFHPNNRGFDDFYGFLGGGHQYFPERFRPIYERQLKAGKEYINDYLLPLEHNGVDVEETEYITDGLSREAVRFVKESAGEKPFFLYLAYNAPHSPLEAREEDLKKYAKIRDQKRRTYAAMVHAVDRGVGQLVDALRESGEFQNTLIVFLSDNGGKLSLGATNRPLREGKGSAYEGGYRVPMFFHWPSNVPAGVRFEHPVTALDFYPTFARLAGAKIPNDKKLDGKDIWKGLLSGQDPRQGSMVYALRHRSGFSDVGVRHGPWKASRVGPQKWKLFHVVNDIGETKDLSAEQPERLRQMVEQTLQWSRNHTEPRWYDSEKAQKSWKTSGMPHYQTRLDVDG